MMNLSERFKSRTKRLKSILPSSWNKFDYEPLDQHQIRLLKFDHPQKILEADDDNAGKKIRCTLEHVDLSTKPNYYALSYVWGKPDTLKKIVVNGQSFKVTPNLYDALLQLRMHAFALKSMMEEDLGQEAIETYFWIDAISINQANSREKSAHVPAMGKIFSQAFNVLVWLGTPESMEKDDEMLDYIRFYVYELQKSHSVHHTFKTRARTLPASKTWPAHGRYAALNVAHFDIIDSEWFKRVWVVQEFALAQRKPIALLGAYVFHLEALKQDPVIEMDGEVGSVHELSRAWILSAVVRGSKMPEFHRDNLNASTWTMGQAQRPLPEALERAILRSAWRKASLLQDCIYGFLGLVDATHLPRHLLPDYEKHYSEVFMDYTRYIFSNTGSLALLDNEGAGDMEKIPSWTADFQPVTIIPADYQPKHKQDNLVISDDGRKLTIDGVPLGRVIASRPGQEEFSEGPKGHEALRWFHDNILAESANLRETTVDTCWKEYMQVVSKITGTKTEYDTLQEILEKEVMEDGEDEEYSPLWFLMQPLGEWGTLLLDNGQIMLYRPKVKDLTKGNHVATVFKGSISYTILEVVESDEVYRLAAQAFYMKDLAFTPVPHEVDADFFKNNKLERFTLV